MPDRMTVLAPEGMLGYGIPERSMAEGLRRDPDVLAVDAGSTDPGPYYRGAGVPFVSRRAFRRDLAMILEAAAARRVPVLRGTAGGGGGRPHVEWTLDVYREILRERGWRFRTAVIGAEEEPALVKAQVAAGHVTPLDLRELWHRLLGGPASEYGRLRQGAGGHPPRARRRGLVLTTLHAQPRQSAS